MTGFKTCHVFNRKVQKIFDNTVGINKILKIFMYICPVIQKCMKARSPDLYKGSLDLVKALHCTPWNGNKHETQYINILQYEKET
jgi:hypothetical protein